MKIIAAQMMKGLDEICPLTSSSTGLIYGGGVRGGDETGDEPIFGRFQELARDDDRDLASGVPYCDA